MKASVLAAVFPFRASLRVFCSPREAMAAELKAEVEGLVAKISDKAPGIPNR